MVSKSSRRVFAGRMLCYANLSRNSGVVDYRIGEDGTEVRFVSGDCSRRDSGHIGKKRLVKMKRLATREEGLASYASRFVHDRYSAKLSKS